MFELDNIAVKGKSDGLLIYAIAEETEQHRAFLTEYYAGNWKKASTLIQLCKNASPEMSDYYDMMYTRLTTEKPFKDGVYRATSK